MPDFFFSGKTGRFHVFKSVHYILLSQTGCFVEFLYDWENSSSSRIEYLCPRFSNFP